MDSQNDKLIDLKLKKMESDIVNIQKINQRNSEEIKELKLQIDNLKKNIIQQIKEYIKELFSQINYVKKWFQVNKPQTQQHLQEKNLEYEEIGSLNEFPISLLISKDNNLQIMNFLFPNKEITFFHPYFQLELNCNIINADPFEFDDISEREEQIQKYQKLFQACPNQYYKIFIVVKFERTDIMKKNVSEIYKYFQKFDGIISLIIFDFHSSEDKVNDKLQLIKKFEQFKFSNIIFFDKSASREEFIIEISQAVQQMKNIPLNLSSTLFEQIGYEIQQRQLEQLNIMIQK